MTYFILLKRVEVALLVMDLGKAKELHVSIEKRSKLGTLDKVDSNWVTCHAIDNESEKDKMDDIGKTLQLKENLKHKTKLTPNSRMFCTQDLSNKQDSKIYGDISILFENHFAFLIWISISRDCFIVVYVVEHCW